MSKPNYKLENLRTACIKCGGEYPDEHSPKCRKPILVLDLIKENAELLAELRVRDTDLLNIQCGKINIDAAISRIRIGIKERARN